MKLADYIRDVPDFPKPGILFKDITTLLIDPHALRAAIEQMAAAWKKGSIDKIVAIESRGFIFGSALALEFGCGFVPARKPGKLPAATVREEYSLEYGSNVLELHRDAIARGDRVLVVDDLLATGGTAKAAAKLVETLGGTVAGFSFVIELDFLHGREQLPGYTVNSLIHY
jgi:adenine phosphoribosyltransferase